LPNFEGPLDLLLYLIKKAEIDIYDIPIASITGQYLAYVELMQELDLEVAGEFILMAATLIRIKVRMLLPRDPDVEEEDDEDPRTELVRQILEYKRFKEVAESLNDYEDRQRRKFPRTYFDWEKKYENKKIIMKEVSMFDLLTAFKSVLDNMPRVDSHNVGAMGPTLEEQIEFLTNIMKKNERIAFSDLMKELSDRISVVVTFIALLELIRSHRILIQQAAVFGEIWIMRR